MNNIHPTMRPFLELFAPKRSAPRCPEDLIEFEWKSFELDEPLICHVEIIPAERGAREYSTGVQLEPDIPASANLFFAYVRGIDISLLLSDDTIQAIEAAALAGNKGEA